MRSGRMPDCLRPTKAVLPELYTAVFRFARSGLTVGERLWWPEQDGILTQVSEMPTQKYPPPRLPTVLSAMVTGDYHRHAIEFRGGISRMRDVHKRAASY